MLERHWAVSPMLSVIIATHESERALVPTLAALVPGAAAGIVREVIVADAGSRDADRRGRRRGRLPPADIAARSRGARLKAAAAMRARAVAAVPRARHGARRQLDRRDQARSWRRPSCRARRQLRRRLPARRRSVATAVRRGALLMRSALGARPSAEPGPADRASSFYDAVGGHRPEAAEPGSATCRAASAAAAS